MGNLTPRQRAKITLAEQAETYIEYQQQQRREHGGSVSRSQYDATGSRSEWADQWT